MESLRMLMLGGVLVTTHAVAAEAIPDPRLLGTGEAILAYCAKVDPAGAPKYQAQLRQIAQGASEEVLTKMRESAAYQEAHQAVENYVASADAGDATNNCKALLEQKL